MASCASEVAADMITHMTPHIMTERSLWGWPWNFGPLKARITRKTVSRLKRITTQIAWNLEKYWVLVMDIRSEIHLKSVKPKGVTRWDNTQPFTIPSNSQILLIIILISARRRNRYTTVRLANIIRELNRKANV